MASNLRRGFEFLNRRGFLAFVAALATAPFSQKSLAAAGPTSSISFFVAGVRFQPSVRGLRAGAPLKIETETFKGAPSYAVRTVAGELLGFVPAKTVADIGDWTEFRARLLVADYDAVPWRRFRVTAASQRTNSDV
jgi:hypothetical protein